MEIKEIPYIQPLGETVGPETIIARADIRESSDLRRIYSDRVAELGAAVLESQKTAYFVGETLDQYGPLPETAFYAGRAALYGAEANLAKFKTTHDPLTGALNREGFMHALQDDLVEVANSPVKDLAVLVLMSDTDKFKTVNDTHGHEAGDEVLRHIASALAIESAVRINREDEQSNDAVAREGGDEFKVSMVVPRDQAEKIVSRIRERLDEISLTYKNGQEIKLQVGLSIGAVLIDAASIRLDHLNAETNRLQVDPEEIKRLNVTVDAAMYAEKQRRQPPTLGAKILRLFKLQKIR